MATLNDVMDFAKYYKGKDEPPMFYHEHFDIKGKLFVPIDDYKMVKHLCIDPKEHVVVHYYARDDRQNALFHDVTAHKDIHSRVYAVASPDFSVDSSHCYSCLNLANILKARIIASVWQEKYEERVILNLIWGNKGTFDMAFGNIEKGTIVSVSSQAIESNEIFEAGIKTAIDRISPERICWYGPVMDKIDSFYDRERIVKMDTRSSLMKRIQFIEDSMLFDIEAG